MFLFVLLLKIISLGTSFLLAAASRSLVSFTLLRLKPFSSLVTLRVLALRSPRLSLLSLRLPSHVLRFPFSAFSSCTNSFHLVRHVNSAACEIHSWLGLSLVFPTSNTCSLLCCCAESFYFERRWVFNTMEKHGFRVGQAASAK